MINVLHGYEFLAALGMLATDDEGPRWKFKREISLMDILLAVSGIVSLITLTITLTLDQARMRYELESVAREDSRHAIESIARDLVLTNDLARIRADFEGHKGAQDGELARLGARQGVDEERIRSNAEREQKLEDLYYGRKR